MIVLPVHANLARGDAYDIIEAWVWRSLLLLNTTDEHADSTALSVRECGRLAIRERGRLAHCDDEDLEKEGSDKTWAGTPPS